MFFFLTSNSLSLLLPSPPDGGGGGPLHLPVLVAVAVLLPSLLVADVYAADVAVVSPVAPSSVARRRLDRVGSGVEGGLRRGAALAVVVRLHVGVRGALGGQEAAAEEQTLFKGLRRITLAADRHKLALENT